MRPRGVTLVAVASMFIIDCVDHVDVTIDLDDPTVASTIPSAGEIGVRRDQSLIAVLSEPVQADSVSDSSFQLLDGTSLIPGSVTMISSSALRLTPATPLQPLEQYTARISGLHDLSVHHMQGVYSWSFFTEDRSWSAAELVSTSGSSFDAVGGAPVVASDGSIVVVWSQSDGTRRRIWSRTLRPEQGWSGIVLIDQNAGTGDASLVPQIASVGASSLAVWVQQSGGNFGIWANRFDPHVGWGVANLLQSAASFSGAFATLSANHSGEALATWSQSAPGGSDLYDARYSVGQGWQAPQLLETHSGAAASSSVALSESHSAVVSWTENTGGGAVAVWARTTPDAGVTWRSPSLLKKANSAASVSPQAATCDASRQVVVWAQNPGTPFSIWSARQDSQDSSWKAAELL
jgi:hypothetical protein